MSARGARGRKVQEKEIVKKEKKIGKSKATDSLDEPRDGYNGRPPTSNANLKNGVSRSFTVSSNGSRATSRSSSTNEGRSRPRLNALHSSDSLETKPMRAPQSSTGASQSYSDSSIKGKEKTKFEAKGKETSAPRGRGGGVPIKTTATKSAALRFRSESAASNPQKGLKTWADFKVWGKGQHGMRPYGGFHLDEDMHSGSVLIYFQEEQMDLERPLPSIQAELDVLENSGSTWLKCLLPSGRIDDDDHAWALPTSPNSLNTPQSPNYYHEQTEPRRMLSPTLPGGRSPPSFDINHTRNSISGRATSRSDHSSEIYQSHSPVSPLPFQSSILQNPTHEIWFTTPDHITDPQEQRLHHVATRNFLALLHGKPIIGADLFDMLKSLQSEIDTRYELDDQNQPKSKSQGRSVQMIINYLGQYGIDDVRSSIKSAMCLLAWSEQENVKWRQGYLEYFVHLAGVMIPELEEVPEFRRLSIVTRRNLGIAGKTLQLRVMEAEERLASFDFADFWEDHPKVVNNPVYLSYQAFRRFLIGHYTHNYGNWPPTSNKTWLNRKIVLALQEDFGSLYDYLVNRDVVWNPREERASRKWEMAHRKNEDFKADVPELGITDVLVRYDAKFGYAHIPHPYPLLPRDIPKTTKDKEKKSFFSSLKKDKSKDATVDAKANLQLSILFSDATNIEKLDVNFNGSTLIDRFEKFEMTTDLKSMTPREARLGRWVLLYGILQVLSTLSVDVQGLKHKEGVRYFLCTDLKRCPDWVTHGQIEHLEASQQRSWCWQRSWDPAPIQAAPVELEATSSHDSASEPHYENEIIGNTATNFLYQERSSPTLEGATLIQDDIRRIGEKINSMSLSHNPNYMPHEDIQHRDNEKANQPDFDNHNPHYDTFPQPPQPSPAYQARPPDTTFRLTGSDFSDAHTLVPPPRSPMRQTVNTTNIDSNGYPFSPDELQWPVPPGYTEINRRESGVGYHTGSWNGQPEHGNGYLDARFRARDADRRSPRRMHERNE